MSLLLVVAACGQTEPSVKPSYEVAECKFTPPRGHTVECGYLTVPEDRSKSGGTTIRLHVAVFKSASENPAADPIVYLEGGPGGSTLELISLTFNSFFAPLQRDRDLILFDQRGVGVSEPALDCPQAVEAVYDSLSKDLSTEAWASRNTESASLCRDSLTGSGVNLSAYTSAENAADLNDLRQALGYQEWNLLGVSYGTKLALTAMRDFPQGIRSVILDSTYPPQVDAYSSIYSGADRAFAVLFDGCSADPGCDAAYPELETRFYELVDELEPNPLRLRIAHPLTGRSVRSVLDGDALVGFLFQSLYATDLIPTLPELIYDLRAGRTAGLARIQGQFLILLDLISLGMHYSVQCGEEAHFTSPEQVRREAEVFPRHGGYFDREPILDICSEWGVREADNVENEPVASDIPTLVLAGEYDPVTPPAWGELAADGLENSFFLEFPGLGHGVSLEGGCPLGIIQAFLDEPSVKPDSICITRMGGPVFSLPDEQRPLLGVRVTDVSADVAAEQRLPETKGALVLEVVSGSPAEVGGMRPGDVILALGDSKVTKARDVPRLLGTEFGPGQELTLTVVRDRRRLEIALRLGEGLAR